MGSSDSLTVDDRGACSNAHMLHGAGIFTYTWVIFRANVGKYSIHGAYVTEPMNDIKQIGSK